MNYKISYLILTTFLLLIFPSCDDDSKPDPTLDYCTQFNEENECQKNGCVFTGAFKGYFHNSKCIGYQPGKFCLPPVIMCHNNVTFNSASVTIEGTPYMYFTVNGCERFEWNPGETVPSCSVEEESCNTNSTREECLGNYCYWVQAKKAVLDENSCTGWETDNTNMCLGSSFLVSTYSISGITTDMFYKSTADGTEVFKIESFETNEKIGGVFHGDEIRNLQGEYAYVNFDDDEKIYQEMLFDIWELCHLDNPICNCPEQ